MRKLYYLIKMSFLTKFAYMKAFWFNIAGTAVAVFIYYFLWQFVFRRQNMVQGFSAAQMTTYVILSRMLSSQFSGGINEEFSHWVREGSIAIELLRPVSLFFTLAGKRIGEFCFFVLFKGIPVTLLCTVVLSGVGPAGMQCLFAFVVSVLLSVGIMFFMEFMAGLCSFYTLHSYGLAYTKSALFSILSGGVVPIFLFPETVSRVLEYLPFAGMVSVPVHIYLGKYEVREMLSYMGLQVVWLVVMYVLAKFLYARIIKRVVVQGG